MTLAPKERLCASPAVPRLLATICTALRGQRCMVAAEYPHRFPYRLVDAQRSRTWMFADLRAER